MGGVYLGSQHLHLYKWLQLSCSSICANFWLKWTQHAETKCQYALIERDLESHLPVEMAVPDNHHD
jgi:hypothetical protein